MKVTKTVLGLLIVVILFTGCSSDDDAVTLSETITSADLEGTWNLIRISGGITGSVENFERGEVLWQFDRESETLIIQDSNNTEDILIEGTFTFSILQSEGFSFLITDNQEQGLLTLSGSNLELNLGRRSDVDISDSFQLNFER